MSEETTRVVMTVHTITEVSLHGVALDVPAEVAAKGEAAISEWARNNVPAVDYAKTEWTETCAVREVLSVSSVDIKG
jgi:hypothetical protein